MSNVFADDNQPSDTDPKITLEALVGPDKKFKTADDLAKGKAEADAFIDQLKRELAELRTDLGRRESTTNELEAIREELKVLRAAKSEQSRDNTNPQLTVDGIEALVAEKITQVERNRTASQNVLEANSAMVKHFGDVDKAGAAVKAKAEELGFTMDDLKAIAAKSPTAFKKIMLGDATNTAQNPIDGTVSTERPIVSGNDPERGTKSYYDAMRKTDPKKYWTPQVQQEIFQALKQGKYQL